MSLQPIKVLHLIPTLSSGGGESKNLNETVFAIDIDPSVKHPVAEIP